MKTVTIPLPMPSRNVSPNASRGQSKLSAILKAKSVKQHRAAAHASMLVAIANGAIPPGQTPVGYSLSFFYKTMLFRDEGNAEGSCKAYIDGICDALKITDRHFNKLELTKQAKDETKAPKVEINLFFDYLNAEVERGGLPPSISPPC